MIPWRLVPARLWAHPVRSTLTAASMAIAAFLICFLVTAHRALTAGVEASAANRLIVQSKVSLFVNLPEAYQAKIAAVEGIETTCKMQWFGGVYQDPSNFFAQFAVDPGELLDLYPEIELVEVLRADERTGAGDASGSGSATDATSPTNSAAGLRADAFERNRASCIIGEKLAKKFGFEVGQTIPIIGQIFPRNDASPWEFLLAGVYRAAAPNVDENTLYFHYDYLRESLESGAASGREGVGVYALRIEPDASAEQVMAHVDALFENGPQRVQTTTEAEFSRQFVTMFGNVPTLLGAIGGGVVFAVLLAVLNTMWMAARERTREIGVLKALGFRGSSMFWVTLGESMLLSLAGAAVGIAAAVPAFSSAPAAIESLVPLFALETTTALAALACSAGIGLLAAIFPSMDALRLRPVEAFRAEV